jgi:hypothetical protein
VGGGCWRVAAARHRLVYLSLHVPTKCNATAYYPYSAILHIPRISSCLQLAFQCNHLKEVLFPIINTNTYCQSRKEVIHSYIDACHCSSRATVCATRRAPLNIARDPIICISHFYVPLLVDGTSELPCLLHLVITDSDGALDVASK